MTRLDVAGRVGLALAAGEGLVLPHGFQLLERLMQVRGEGPSAAREAVKETQRLPVTTQTRMPSRSREQQRAQVRTQPPQDPSRQFGRCLSDGITPHHFAGPAIWKPSHHAARLRVHKHCFR